MTPNNPNLAQGNPEIPYWDAYIDAVTESDGIGGYRLKTAGGGGGSSVSGNTTSQIIQPLNFAGEPLGTTLLQAVTFDGTTGAKTGTVYYA